MSGNGISANNTISQYTQAGTLTQPRGNYGVIDPTVAATYSIKQLIEFATQGLQRYCISATGAVSPYLNGASVTYMDVENYTFSECDF
jgi:hypothetical protein